MAIDETMEWGMAMAIDKAMAWGVAMDIAMVNGLDVVNHLTGKIRTTVAH